MDKIERYKVLAEVYQDNMYSLLEEIVNQKWSEYITEEEKRYVFLEQKLKTLDEKKYGIMANMYNTITNIREEAYIIQKVLDKQQNIKRISP